MKHLKLLFGLCLAVIISAFTLNNTSGPGLDIGDSAPDFNLKDVNGNMVSMASYENAKGFIVIFTCNTCPYSIAYEDRIIALDKKYKGKGYPVIAVNPNDPAAQPGDSFALMQERAKEKGFTFPYLLDVGQEVYPKYGATRTPHVFLLNKEAGDLKVKYIGAIDNNSKDASKVTEKFTENAVDALLAGKTVEKTSTRAIGCSIKVVK
jgi:peroxiredoxin